MPPDLIYYIQFIGNIPIPVTPCFARDTSHYTDIMKDRAVCIDIWQACPDQPPFPCQVESATCPIFNLMLRTVINKYRQASSATGFPRPVAGRDAIRRAPMSPASIRQAMPARGMPHQPHTIPTPSRAMASYQPCAPPTRLLTLPARRTRPHGPRRIL